MISAEARKLNDEYFSSKQTRRNRRRRINKEQVRRWLVVSGLLLSLMTANSIIQALLAQTQLRLEQAQTKLEALDKELGQLQFELAGLSSYERVERVAAAKFGMLRSAEISNLSADYSLTQVRLEEVEIPLYELTTEFRQETGRRNTGLAGEINRWISGLGRAMATDRMEY